MTTLPNGAQEISRKRTHDDREIVLAVWEKWGRPEYVTWEIFHNDDATTTHGHYFTTIGPATLDFTHRS